jgi:histidine triad (HIT) family protein
MDECLFCRIAAREIPSKVVYEDSAALAFLDIHPCAPGHTVIIPKVHADTLLALADEDTGPLFLAVKRVTDQLMQGLRPDGFTVGINHGRTAGQAVDHLHIHVIPRWVGDGGGSIHSVVRNAPKEGPDDLLAKIRMKQ